MINSFEINGYRRFKELKFDELSNINVIVGDNNVGKTTILEAIFMWACGYNLTPILTGPVARNRYSANITPNSLAEEIISCFYDKSSLSLKLSGTEDKTKKEFEHKAVFVDSVSQAQSISVDLNSVNDNFAKIPQQLFTNVTPIGYWDIKGSGDDKVTRLQLTVPNVLQGNKPYRLGKYIDILSHINQSENIRIYADMKTSGLLDNEFVDQLRSMYPDIESIDNIPYMDATQGPISIKVKGKGYLPIYSFGDGLQRLYHILGCIKLYKDAILCIDELDAGFHPSSQRNFCMQLINYALRYNTQLFMTTHNIEFLDHFLEAAAESKRLDKIRIITLKPNENDIAIRTLTGEEALRSRKYYEMELR